MIKDPDDAVFSAIITGCNPTNKNVLDVGCGGGELVARLAELAETVVGIDPEATLVEQANGKYSGHNIHFFTSDNIGALDENLQFDVVLFIKSLHHFEAELMYKTLVDAAARLSAGDTILVIEPIYRSGTFQEIVAVYCDEQVEREAARIALEDFSKISGSTSREQIRVRYEVKDFEDLYESEIVGKPYINWNDCYREKIERILSTCPRSTDGMFCLDSMLDIYQLRVG